METNLKINQIGANWRWLAAAVLSAAVLLAGLAEALLGWAQLLGWTPSGNARFSATGTFYNPGPFCGFLAVVIPLALSGAMQQGRRWAVIRWLALACLMASASLMPALMGRTGWIAALAGSALVMFASGRWRWRGRPWLLAAVPVAAAAAVGAYLLKPASAQGRLFLWQTAWNAAMEHPLRGVGWTNVAGALGDAQEAFFAANPDSAFATVAGAPEYAFNEYLQLATAYGLPAMAAFVALLGAALWCALRGRAYGIAGSIAALAVVCFASYPFQFWEFVALGAMLLVAAAAVAPRIPAGAFVATALGVTILGAAAGAQLAERRTSAGEWSKLRYAYRAPLSERHISELDSLTATYGSLPAFLFDYGKALRESGRYGRSTAVLRRGLAVSSDPMFLNLIGRNHQSLGSFEEAEACYRRSINRLPGRLYPHYLLAKLYADPRCADSAAFARAYERAMALEPKVMSPAIRDMRRELASLRDSITR